MAKVETNLVTIASRGKSVEIDVNRLSPEIIAKLITHGVTQKVADAAAGAMKVAGFEGIRFSDLSSVDQVKVQDAGKALMQKVVDNLLEGNWGVERSGGAGVDPLTAEIRAIIRPLLKAGMAKEKWAALSADERDELADAAFEKAAPEKRANVEKVAQNVLDQKRAAKKLIESISI